MCIRVQYNLTETKNFFLIFLPIFISIFKKFTSSKGNLKPLQSVLTQWINRIIITNWSTRHLEKREREKNVYYVKSCRKDGTLDRNDIRTSDNNGVTFRDSSYSAWLTSNYVSWIVQHEDSARLWILPLSRKCANTYTFVQRVKCYVYTLDVDVYIR